MPGLWGKCQPGRVRARRECPGCLRVHTKEPCPPGTSQLSAPGPPWGIRAPGAALPTGRQPRTCQEPPAPPPRGDLPRGFLSLHSSFQPATPCVLSLDPPSDAEPPKIRVPRHLRQTYIRQVGETVNLQIPFQGSPKPQASWTHDGHALDAQRVNVRTGDQDSILFIRSAQRSDSGCYELTMRLEGLEAKAAIDILVIGTGPGEAGLPGWDLETPPPTRADADGTGPGSVTGAQSWGWRFCGKPWHPPHPPSRSGPAEKPGPPSSIRLLDVWGCNAALEWMPPQDTGNTELLGYTVQKADRKTGQWFTVLERYHPTTCTISDLIVGNAYSFRVFSENQCGLSATAATTKELARIQKADIVAKTKGFVERDFSEAPSFTQPLADHTSTPGYSTQLFCSVRASPKVRARPRCAGGDGGVGGLRSLPGSSFQAQPSPSPPRPSSARAPPAQDHLDEKQHGHPG
uniref:Myosin binding protein H n=1 Tax=Canis lupus dingo TaxID=286419 RepID=A0A8C0KSP0_CANLU